MKRTTCRVCHQPCLIDILSLGNLAISDFNQKGEHEQKAPLTLTLCDPKQGGCSLLQLRHDSVDPDDLYRQYWYKSGTNISMRNALEDIVRNIEKRMPLTSGDIVTDIGANDGTMLRFFSNRGVQRTGFEPAKNLRSDFEHDTDVIVNDFFSQQKFKEKIGKGKQAKVITTIAMFYDLEDPNTFVGELAACLDRDGIWVNQMAYLPAMLATNDFTNICHEHLEYYSLASLQALLSLHHLRIMDVEFNTVNGGSFRTYIAHESTALQFGPSATRRLRLAMKKEEAWKLDKVSTYQRFAKKVEAVRKRIGSFISKEVKKGKTVFVYGASTKGNTLLQYCDLTHHTIPFAVERNPAKWGRRTVATHIPIISEAHMREEKPDYLLVLPWHFRKEFMQREKKYLKDGGAMIFPLPTPEIVSIRKNKTTTLSL